MLKIDNSGAAWAAGGVPGGGTVTSVAVSGSDGIEVDSGSPITGAGTIALGLNKATALSHLNVEDGADVTDATNVEAAGALMDSELTSLSGVKTLTVPDNTTVSTFGASLVDDADAAAARTTLGLGTIATQAASNVAITGGTLGGITSLGLVEEPPGPPALLGEGQIKFANNQIVYGDGTVTQTVAALAATQTLTNKTISGSSNTLSNISLTSAVTGTLPVANGGTGVTALSSINAADLGSGGATTDYVLTADGSGGVSWAAAAASGGDVSDGDTLSLGLTFPNDGLKVLESGSGSTLQLSTDTDLTADRVLTVATGDANRTLTFSANATIGGTNSGDVTLAGSLDYLTISGQEITRNAIDLATDVTGTLPVANGGTGQTSLGSVDAADLGAGASADGQVLMSDGSAGAAWEALPCEIGVACSDETTALTTGTAKVTLRMPYAMTLTAVRASVTTAPTGSTLIVDINEAGSSVLSTKLSIDATEKTSTTAATAAVISDSALADDAEITIDIDQIGSTIAGTGLKVWLIGTRA